MLLLEFTYQFDYKMNRNEEVRIDGIGAQATAQNNRTFDNARLNVNKLTKLVIRKIVRGKRKEVTKAMREQKDAADDRKLLLREKRVEVKQIKDRANHAIALILWEVEPHHTTGWYEENQDERNEGEKSIEEELDACGGNKTKRKAVLQQNYNAIVVGWDYKQYACAYSGSSACSLCRCKCQTGFEKGGHMEVQ